jgi:predicted dehydrogenase
MGNNAKLKAGVIGVGRMGQFHVNVYSELPDTELVGVADIDPDAGRAMVEKFRVDYFDDYSDLLKKLDVASIAVPTALHYEVAREALLNDVHILVEKPISDSYEKARELFDIAKQRGLVLHVGHVERFNGAVQELHKLARDPLLVESRRMGPFDARMKNDGVVLDLMIHDIDILLNLVDSDVEKVHVLGRSVHSDNEDMLCVQIRFASGCLATMTASRATQNKMRTMSITCRDKYVHLDFADQEIQVHSLVTTEYKLERQELRYKEVEQRERIFVHREHPLKLELRHLIDCVLNRADRRVSVENELKSLKLALEILEKYKNKVTV